MEDKHCVLYTEVNLGSLKQNVYSIMKTANERCKFSPTDDMFHLERAPKRAPQFHITSQPRKWEIMSGIKDCIIRGHIWNNGKQMASERTRSMNINNRPPNQCPLNKFNIQ